MKTITDKNTFPPHNNIYSHQCRSLPVVHQDLALLVLPFVPRKTKTKIKFRTVTDIKHISIRQIQNSPVDQGAQGVLYLPAETDMCSFL